MFLGQFQHNLDDKGRLMIPARYRDLLAAGAYITQGFDKCLMVMTESHFNEVYALINVLNMADPSARMLRRLILSNAYQVEVDKVGRILVPQNLREFLGIANGELVVAGQGELSLNCPQERLAGFDPNDRSRAGHHAANSHKYMIRAKAPRRDSATTVSRYFRWRAKYSLPSSSSNSPR